MYFYKTGLVNVLKRAFGIVTFLEQVS